MDRENDNNHKHEFRRKSLGDRRNESDESLESNINYEPDRSSVNSPSGQLTPPQPSFIQYRKRVSLYRNNEVEKRQSSCCTTDQCLCQVDEYKFDIIEYWRESELLLRPDPNYMRWQIDITRTMRIIVVDWLIDVSVDYWFNAETVHLAVSYIDRFLSVKTVRRNKFQLVSVTALYIAAKYEEIYPGRADDYAYYTNGAYNTQEVLQMESVILKALNYDMRGTTAYAFLNAYVALIRAPNHIRYMSLYLCDLALLIFELYVNFNPSIISAASLALARYLCFEPIWSTELEQITTYNLNDMKQIFLQLVNLYLKEKNLPYHSVRDKYNSQNYLYVSKLISPIAITEAQYDALVEKYNDAQNTPNKKETEQEKKN